MTNDGSSRTFAELPALLAPDGSSSRTSSDYLPQTTGTLWPESVRRWPKRVSADGSGRLHERPTSAPVTDANGGSVLPTPTARDHKGHNQRRDATCLMGAVDLLPTPAAADGARGPDLARANRPDSGGMDLVTTVERLLPTPTASDWKNAGYRKGPGDTTYATLPGAIGSAPTKPRSTDGPMSSDDQHPTR